MALNDETQDQIPGGVTDSAGPKQMSKPTRIRWYGGALIFVICFVAYLDRIVFSLSATSIIADLHITAVQLGFVITLFNVGYFICQIPGGILIERVGARRVMTVAFLAWSICTGLTGLANGLFMLALTRFAFGAGEAPVFPASNSFFARWFPTRERGKANSLMNAGAFLGPALGPILIVPLIQSFSWRGAFFACAALGLVLTIVVWGFMRDRPALHRRVNQAEIQLVEDGTDVAPSNGRAPWKSFLRQRSFWTLALGFFGTLWTIQFFIYWLPYYLQKGLGVPFASVGTYTSIAFVCITVSVLVAGVASDRLLRSGRSKFQSRNLVAVAGLVVAAVCLIMSLTSNDVFISVVWLSVALGGAGFAQTLAWTIATDIGRSHTSAVGSWMNAWGFVAAAIVPTLAPILAQQLGWTSVIVVNAAVAVLGIIGFLLTRTNQPLLDSAGTPAHV
jgi:ACS family glucarate transporter-like MFS transporter